MLESTQSHGITRLNEFSKCVRIEVSFSFTLKMELTKWQRIDKI